MSAKLPGRRVPMCEFCLKHAEGKKWYLEAENYSEDLLSDIRRRKFVEEFFGRPENLARDAERLETLSRAPAFIKAIMRRVVTGRMKKNHFGQVVPLEDVEEIFGFVNSIIRVACACRQVGLGEEKRYCYGISMGPDGGKMGEILRGLDTGFFAGPDASQLETVSKEEALSAFHDHELEGLCHSVWTFQAPFIGGICNCDRADCLAIRSTVTHDIPIMFRAEYVAEIDPELCVGCRQCMRVCQFGAIGYSAARQKAFIDQRDCYGCGVCRAVCKKDAIVLRDRSSVPVAADLW
jgi:Pyruvate/2-oxoacid:ferredoxin oxidoreductase delta subunit